MVPPDLSQWRRRRSSSTRIADAECSCGATSRGEVYAGGPHPPLPCIGGGFRTAPDGERPHRVGGQGIYPDAGRPAAVPGHSVRVWSGGSAREELDRVKHREETL